MRVLRILTSQQLSCGCHVGIYELYSGEVVSILDERDRNCRDEAHRPGQRFELSSDNALARQRGT